MGGFFHSPMWSTDPETAKRMHALQDGVPLIAAQYDARSEVDLQHETINLIFPKATPASTKVECWSRISHMLKTAGVEVE